MIMRTKLTPAEIEYRKKIISDMKSICCPITKEILSVNHGEAIYCNGVDYFISTKGLEKLVEIFGEKFIEDRIITWD